MRAIRKSSRFTYIVFNFFDNEINNLVFVYKDPDPDSDKYFEPYYYDSDYFEPNDPKDEFLNKIWFLESRPISLVKRLSSDSVKHQ